MASVVFDRGGTDGLASTLPADLIITVQRVVARVGGSVRPIGPAAAQVVEAADLPGSAATDDGAIGLVCDGTPWPAPDALRAVIATDFDAGRSALEAIADIENDACDAGWRVVFTGLMHAGNGTCLGRREHPLVLACRPPDKEVADLLAAGPLSLALDPAIGDGDATAARPARVLIASYEVSGPTGNGGIGTAYHSLAHVLAGAGHDVTLLFTGWLDPDRAAHEAEWRATFAREGIAFAMLGTPWNVPVRSPHHAVRRAYELHRWLAQEHTRRPFDVVHVPECLGHGAFALTAKALGLAYHDVEFVVGTHSSTRWVAEANRQGLQQLDDLVTEHLERVSVERADVVLSPTAYLLEYMRSRGWRLPERTFVQPLARPQAVRQMSQAADEPGETTPRRELVFFGRLETRKGLEAFCDAVDLLVSSGDCPFERITLLGRPEQVIGEDAGTYVHRRAQHWERAWQILPDLGHADAIAYLRSSSCVVAIPSLVDNSPNTVIEVVALGVPFVASRSGGTGELIAARDLADTTFDGWSAATTLEPPRFSDVQEAFDVTTLAAMLREKATAPAGSVSPAVDDVTCDRVYDAWHRTIAGRTRPVRPVPAGASPTADVCLVGCDEADIGRVAHALAHGTRKPARVVALCDEPIAEPPTGVEIVVAPGRGAGPARARIARELDADVLIVLRGSEQPDPTLVERVCSAMHAGEAALLSLVVRDHDRARPTDTPEALRRGTVDRDVCAFVPVGGPALAPAAYPALAVGPYAIRRAALAELGGFEPDVWGEAVDQELRSRAALAGLRIDVLPDPVVTSVRDDRWARVRAHYWGTVPLPVLTSEEQILLLRPFRRLLDERLADLPAQLVGVLRAWSDATERTAAETKSRAQLVETYEQRLSEHRELIELYERQKEEMRAALASGHLARDTASRRISRRLRRAVRPPLSALPIRAVRFARWRLEVLRRRSG